MIEGLYLTNILDNIIPVPSFLGIFFFYIENSSFHRGGLNNNDNMGFPFFGGYKEILELDATIFPCILKEIQYSVIIYLRRTGILLFFRGGEAPRKNNNYCQALRRYII